MAAAVSRWWLALAATAGRWWLVSGVLATSEQQR